MADPGPMLSKVYNQQGKGLTVVDKYGEATSVANVSVECFRSIVSIIASLAMCGRSSLFSKSPKFIGYRIFDMYGYVWICLNIY